MLTGAVHQPLDLALGEIAPFNCQIYDAWCASLGCRFHADKPCLRATYCVAYTSFLHSRKGRSGRMPRDRNAGMEVPGRVHGMAAGAGGPTAFFGCDETAECGARAGAFIDFTIV